MNLVELIAAVRTDLLDSPNNTSPWGDDDAEMENAIVRYINRAHRFMMLKRVESDAQFYTEAASFTDLGMTFETEGRFSVVKVPDFVFAIQRIEQMGEGAVWADGEEIVNVPLVNASGEILLRNARIYTSRGLRWTYLGRRRLAFTPGGTSVGGGFRLYFTRTQPDLVYFKAASGASGRINVDVTSDSIRGVLRGIEDYYVGAKLQIVSASNLAPQEEIGWVTRYFNNGGYPNFRFDIEPTLSSGIEADDEIALIPSFEDEYHELLAYLTAFRCFDREGEVENKLAQSETMKQLWQQFLASGENRQTQRATIPSFDRTN